MYSNCLFAIAAALTLLPFLAAAPPQSPPPKPAALQPAELSRDPALEAPAWGRPAEGLRLGVYCVLRDAEIAGRNELHVVLHNTADAPRLVNAGTMIANGRRLVANELVFTLRGADGAEYRLRPALSRIAGRIDPWLILLAPGDSYTFRLGLAELEDDGDLTPSAADAPTATPSTTKKENAGRHTLPHGDYTVTAGLRSRPLKAADLNGDTPGLATWKVFDGELMSGETHVDVRPVR